MSARHLHFLALLGSAGLLLGALAFQYLGGLAPCPLCIWQRWPHVVALAGIGVFWLPATPFALLGAAGAATSGGIGVYHTGVERGWWEGPNTCAAATPTAQMTPEELLAQIMDAPVVRCTDVPWELLGLSMASWNAVLSFAIAGAWLWSLRVRSV